MSSNLELFAASLAVFGGCMPAPAKPTAPCVTATPVAAVSAPPLSDVVHMANSGSLHVWAFAVQGPPVRRFAS